MKTKGEGIGVQTQMRENVQKSDFASAMPYGGLSEQKELPPETLSSTRDEPAVSFHLLSDFPGWDLGQEWILNIIKAHGSTDILEVGSGANPTLSPEVVSVLNLRYTANDSSATELDKADSGIDRWVYDISADEIPPAMRGRFDLVFSRMVNEHIADGEAYHGRIHTLLKRGGIAAHCFSTLYALPFLANRLLPESLSAILLNVFQPRDPHKLGKFRAYYSWSRGPSAAMISRFELLGYEVLKYKGYFGHRYYSRVPPLHWLERQKARVLFAWPVPALCSYGMLIARKR